MSGAKTKFNVAADYLTSIHTHDATGIIHIESPTPRTFTLGEFFDVWGVRFTASCLGGYCRSSDRALSVFVLYESRGDSVRYYRLSSSTTAMTRPHATR
ncbi:MAG TPA: hypothetical protein VF972_01920 [Actinomycetota bacterium]